MFCMVCGLTFDQAFHFCVDCGKVMCSSCMNKHAVYYKNSKERHQSENISHLKRFFEVEAALDKGKCRNKHDKNAEYFCKKCKKFTCASCLSLYHQHGKNKKVEHFTTQIQEALIGCENMLESKENEFQTIVEKLKRKEMDLQQQRRKTDQLILQTTKELWYRVATALRMCEKAIRTRCLLKFDRDESRIRNQAENVNYFLEILRHAKSTVEKFNRSNAVPLQKEIFSNLSLLNRINTKAFNVHQKADNDLAFPRFLCPKDAEVEEMCKRMLALENNQAFFKDGNVQELNQNFQTDCQGSHQDDDLFSFGETDEDFGEYFVIGVPQVKGRSTTAQQVIKGPLNQEHGGGAGSGLKRDERSTNRAEEKAQPILKLSKHSWTSKDNSDDISKSYHVANQSSRKNHKKDKNYYLENHVKFEQPIAIPRSKNQKYKNSVKSNSHANLHRDPETVPHDNTASDVRSYSTGNLHFTREPIKEKHPSYSTTSEQVTASSKTSSSQHGSSNRTKGIVYTTTIRNTVKPHKSSSHETFSQPQILNGYAPKISSTSDKTYVQQRSRFNEKVGVGKTEMINANNQSNRIPNKSKKHTLEERRPKFLLRTTQDQLFLNSRLISTAL